MNALQLNPCFNAKEFLQQYWQKRPVLLPGFIPEFSDAISAEELAGLACEEFIESRLITQPESGHWQLHNGPFSESDFTALPNSNWTILVQAVDQWLGEVADIKTLFDFIPSWRVEDIMVSYATPGGGVGPHFDYYDVFLLQGLGKRRWQLGPRCNSEAQLKAGSELGILQNFEPAEEFQLSPGDALYIPPRFAHWGTAESDSLCYSIGFRAPSIAEMIEGFSDFLIKEQDPALRYEDNKLSPKHRKGQIELSSLEPSFHMLTERLNDKQKFVNWFGCYTSQPKYPELVAPLEAELSSSDFAHLVNAGVHLQRNPSSRFAFIESQNDLKTYCFVDGSMVTFPLESIESIALICSDTELSSTEVTKLCQQPIISELLRQLLNQGSLLLPE